MAAREPLVEVVDPQGIGPAAAPVVALARAVLDAERASGLVVVAFVDEDSIADLNTRYRLPESTDVLSFRSDEACEPWPEVASVRELGEVVICPAVVQRYAIEERVPGSRQLGWTLVHGVLHLLGYDHECDHGEMRVREKELIELLTPLIDCLQ